MDFAPATIRSTMPVSSTMPVNTMLEFWFSLDSVGRCAAEDKLKLEIGVLDARGQQKIGPESSPLDICQAQRLFQGACALAGHGAD